LDLCVFKWHNFQIVEHDCQPSEAEHDFTERCNPVYLLMQEESFFSYDCCILYRLNAAIRKVILMFIMRKKR